MPSTAHNEGVLPPTPPDRLLAVLASAVPPGFWSHRSVVAVSGGADSVALLVGLMAVAPPDSRRLVVVAHAEHDLRATASQDRVFVERLATELGLEIVCRRLEVRRAGTRRQGVEAVARRLRYAFLEEVAHSRGARSVVVGHTADDQAETVLHRLLRGTGLHGLAGMRACRELAPGLSLLRPLLGLPRGVAREHLLRVGRRWREDESNLDLAYTRNFLRHEIVARCTAGPYPSASAAVTRLAAHVAAAADALRSAAEFILDTHATHHADGSVVVRSRELGGLDPHLAAELGAALWYREGWPRRDMAARHYEAIAALLREGPPATIDLPGGIRVRRTPEGFVVIQPRGPAAIGAAADAGTPPTSDPP